MLLTVTFLAIVVPSSPVSNFKELGPALQHCFRAPEHSEGMQLTLRFSLDSKGALMHSPQITYSHLIGKAEDQQIFVKSVLASVAACTPVPIDPNFGRAIAGRPMTIRFIGGGRATAI